MRPGRAIAGILALAGAVVLAVAGADALRVDDRLEAGDVRYAEAPPGSESWPAPARPLVHVPDGLLAVDDDVRLRRALQLARASRVETIDATVLARLRSQAEEALLELAAGGADAARRSLAANVLGALFYDDSLSARSNASVFVSRSLGAFRAAIRLDPEAVEPKRNLELLLSLTRRQLEEERSIGRGGSGSQSRRFGGAIVQQGY